MTPLGLIARLRPTLGAAELRAVLAPAPADAVARFEQAFAKTMEQRHAIAFPYGRTALALLLEALELPGHEVICPTYTCVVVPHAIVKAGLEPVFVDSRARDFNMDLDLAEAAVTPQTGALVATSLFGYPVDLDRLAALRDRHPKLRVVQDCAHGFAAAWRGRAVQRAGDAAIFGLNVSKLMTSIFGGMVTTDDDALAARLRALRDRRLRAPAARKSLMRRAYLLAVTATFPEPIYALTNRLERAGALDRLTRYYDEALIDMPADWLDRMLPVEAAVGLAQLARYPAIVAHRRRRAAAYDAALRGLPGLTLPPLVAGATYSHYVPRTLRRAELLAAGLAHGVQLGQLIEYSCADMAAYRGRPGNRHDCPVARELAQTTINLPLATDDAGAARVVAFLEQAHGRR